MNQLIAIALGGSVGAVTRFFVANGIYSVLGRSFPHGTLFVNVSGSFLMGFLSVLMLQRFPVAVEYRAAILVGFLGAYTTFSTFALETITLFEEGGLLKAFLNIFLSVVLCLVALWVGLIWGRTLFSDEIFPWLGQNMPYLDMLLSVTITLILTIVVEFLFSQWNVSTQIRSVGLILLLGILTISSTLWLTFKLSETNLEFHGLLSMFVINTLSNVAMVWLGIIISNRITAS